MKTFIIAFLIAVLSNQMSAQDWKTNILVNGNLPEETNINTFQAQVRTAITNNVDSASYVFDIRVIGDSDTLYYETKLDIKGDVKEGQVLKTFEISIYNFFVGKYDSAIVRTRFFAKREF